MSAGGQILYINPDYNQNAGMVIHHINSATVTNMLRDVKSHKNVCSFWMEALVLAIVIHYK